MRSLDNLLNRRVSIVGLDPLPRARPVYHRGEAHLQVILVSFNIHFPCVFQRQLDVCDTQTACNAQSHRRNGSKFLQQRKQLHPFIGTPAFVQGIDYDVALFDM